MTEAPGAVAALPDVWQKILDDAESTPAPESAPRAQPHSDNGNGKSDLERARLYVAKVPSAAEGDRNTGLNGLAYRLLERFHLSEAEHLELCLEWNAICAPPLSDREAQATIGSAWKGCHGKGAAGVKRTKQHPSGNGSRAEQEPGAGEEGFAPWPEIEDLRQVLDNPPPRPAELIEGVCFEQSKIYLSAPSKARKSFLQIFLALCIATGSRWFGNAVTRGRVLYLNLELRPWVFQSRARQIAERMGVVLEPGWLEVWNLRGVRVTVEQLAGELDRRIEPGRYSLLDVDPLYKLLGDREENKAGDIADLMGRLEAIATRAGSALLFAHHFGKGSAYDKAALDRGAGSGVLGRDCDLSLTMTPHKEDDHFVLEAVHRDFAPMPPVVLAWRYPLYEVTDLDPTELRKGPGRRTKEVEGSPPPTAWNTERFVQAYLGPDPKLKAAILGEAEKAGIKDHKADGFIKKAVGMGLAHRWENGPHKQPSFATAPQPILLLQATGGGGVKSPPHTPRNRKKRSGVGDRSKDSPPTPGSKTDLDSPAPDHQKLAKGMEL